MEKKPTRLLIISCATGLGHVRAAEALLATAKTSHPDLEVLHLELASHSGPVLRFFFTTGYQWLMTTWPMIYGKLFYATDRPAKHETYERLAPLFARSIRPLLKKIAEFNPDRIITTHFVVPPLIKKYLSCPLDMVITDYYAHRVWDVNGVRHCFVATQEVSKQLNRAADYIVSGLPVAPKLLRPYSPTKLQRKLQTPSNFQIVLLLAGGTGLADTYPYARALLEKLAPNTLLIAIAGKNNYRLLRRLQTLSGADQNHYRAFGFVKNIADWLRLANVIITKPGGLSITEALTVRKPLILVAPLPGQEEENAQYLEQKGWANYADTPAKAAQLAANLLQGSPPKINPLPQNPNNTILNRVLEPN